jgi:hypothetical protein
MHRPLSESGLRAQAIRACASCGRPLWRANAKKRFCSDRCRQAGHRKGKWEGRYDPSRSAPHHPSDLSRFPKNSPAISTGCKANFAGRGIVGPGFVIDIEIGIADSPTDPAFQAKVAEAIAEIPADLTVPNFLKRP